MSWFQKGLVFGFLVGAPILLLHWYLFRHARKK